VPLLEQVSLSPQLRPDEQALAAQLARQVTARVENVLGAWLSAQDDQALLLLYYQPDTPKETPEKVQGWDALLGEASQYLSSESINDQKARASTTRTWASATTSRQRRCCPCTTRAGRTRRSSGR
jgi:hypothetical protein